MTVLGNSKVCGIVSEVTKEIINNLWSDQVFRHFPRNEEEFLEKILDMEELRQFHPIRDNCHLATRIRNVLTAELMEGKPRIWCFVKVQEIVCHVLSRNDCRLKLQIMHSFDQPIKKSLFVTFQR